jgi:predicted kinase
MSEPAERSRLLRVLVGLPYSGKSTFALTLGVPIVCPDSIRMALHGERFLAPAEPLVWFVTRAMVNALFLSGHKTVVLDACNATKARRDEWLPGQTDQWDETTFDVIPTDVETCRFRAQQADDMAVLPVIDRMWSAWDFSGWVSKV